MCLLTRSVCNKCGMVIDVPCPVMSEALGVAGMTNMFVGESTMCVFSMVTDVRFSWTDAERV